MPARTKIPVTLGAEASQKRSGDQDRLEIKYLRPGHACSYGLNIWVRSGRNQGVRKVLNIAWDESGAFDVVSFRRGEWEAALDAAATRQ